MNNRAVTPSSAVLSAVPTSPVTLSIVVPTLNEEGNIALLLQRIDSALQGTSIIYDVLIVDDHSTDNTVSTARSLSNHYPVQVVQKQGKPGKAFSILEGVAQVKGDIICMIDADLQYPPEAIAEMVGYITNNVADVVLTRRISKDTSWLRQFVSTSYNFVFTRALFGIDYDTQSGLKVFRRQVFVGMTLDPSPWSFDLEFIVQCLVKHYKIISHDVAFAERYSGKAKLSVIKASFEVMKATLSLRARVSRRQVKAGYDRSMAHVAHMVQAGRAA